MNLMTAAFLVLAASQATTMLPVSSQIDYGRDVLRRGDYNAAEAILSDAASTARVSEDASEEARALFFLGLSKQQQALSVTAPESTELNEAARDFYLQSIQKYPQATAPLTNLAQIYEALGQRDEARKSLQLALRSNSSRRGYVADKLAELEMADGHFGTAAEIYRQAATAADAPPGIERKVIAAYLAANDRNNVIAYLWEILEKGEAASVLHGALDTLLKGDLNESQVDALFGIVARTLARQNYSSAQLADLSVLNDFANLQRVEAYRNRALSLDALLRGDFAQREAFMAWPEKLNDPAIPQNLSPKHALGELSATLGRRWLFDKQRERAERYLVLARELGPPFDLGLVKDLASLYFDERRLSDLQKLTRESDAELYAEPHMAERIDLALLYEFHRTIGTFHALLEPAASLSSTPSAAVDQLQKAVDAADALSKQLVAEGKEPFDIDSGVIRLLERSTMRNQKYRAKR